MAPETSTRSIRLTALAGSLLLGCAAASQGYSRGNPPGRAAAGGAILAAGSIVAWGIYHLITRKNNGIITIIFPFTSFATNLERHQEMDLIRVLLSSASIGAFTGVLVLATGSFRSFRNKKKAAGQ